MDQNIAIKAVGLGKAYRIWQAPADRLLSPALHSLARWTPSPIKRALNRKAAAGYKDFAALADINFEVKRGEAVAIIGRNGAGKSTLLQLIAGTLQPSSGSIAVNGRVAALLELGAGFNPEFTGRENVFLSGAVLGINKVEMEKRFDEVVSFADVGEFIEQPVKTYSSGMMMRLAFAVNTCVDPEILIVDEALSVGDAPFQAKCFRRLRKLIDEGTTLLFVSHDISTVRSICSRALWLKNGRPEMWGEAKDVAKLYERYCWQEQGVTLSQADESPTETIASSADTENIHTNTTKPLKYPQILLTTQSKFSAAKVRSAYGTGHAIIKNVVTADPHGNPATIFDYGSEVVVYVLLEVMQPVASEFMATFLLRDLKGNSVLAAQDVSNRQRLDAGPGAKYVASIKIPLPLHHQSYVLHTAIFGFKNGKAILDGHYDFGNAVLWEVIDEAAIIEVRPCSTMPLSGPVHLDLPVEVQNP